MSSWLGNIARRAKRARTKRLAWSRTRSQTTLPPGIRGLGARLQMLLGGQAATTTVVIFIFLVGVTTGLLMMPFAAATGEATPLADALFTATSAICVTGLTTLDMATHWSPAGHLIVFVALQVGGIGVMTLATLLAVIASKRLGLSVRKMMAGDVDPSRLHEKEGSGNHGMRLGDVKGLLKTVFISVILIELALAAIIIPRLIVWGLDPVTALWQGGYLAVSAFTNTGFVPLVDGLAPFVADPIMVFTIGFGVFLGSIGFPVIYAIARAVRTARQRRQRRTWDHARLGMHARLTLSTTTLLLVIGAIAIAALEWSNEDTLGDKSPGVKGMTAVFTSMMARSGGFSTVDTAEFSGATLLVLDMLMFVGGGSASTAGGIKVTTLAILFLAAFAESRGNQDIVVYERRIPSDVVRLAVSVVLWGASIVAVSTIALMRVTEAPLDRILFDVISAFATCGLSAGFTSADLPDSAKFILSATMLLGRVGTVTLATALSGTHRQTVYRRAKERPIVG
ncbi:TrkH family potassium uptake protein [Pontimonas sp.]|nr:TrkH family potassium uptake protein [Pontimonas sp.]